MKRRKKSRLLVSVAIFCDLMLSALLAGLILFLCMGSILEFRCNNLPTEERDLLQSAAEELLEAPDTNLTLDNSDFITSCGILPYNQSAAVTELFERKYEYVERCGGSVLFIKYTWFGCGYGLVYCDAGSIKVECGAAGIEIEELKTIDDYWFLVIVD